MRIFHGGSILLSVFWPCFASSGNHNSNDTTKSLNQGIDFNSFLLLLNDFGVIDLQLTEDFEAPDGITLRVESLYGLYVPPKNKRVIFDNNANELILKLNYEIWVNAKASHNEMKNFVRAKFVSEENLVTFRTHFKDGGLSLEEDTVEIELNDLRYRYVVSYGSTNFISDLANTEDSQINKLESTLLRIPIHLGSSAEEQLIERLKTIIKILIVKFNGVDLDLQNKQMLAGTFFRTNTEQIFGRTWALPPDVKQAFNISEDSLLLTISEALENYNGTKVTLKLHSFENFHLSRLEFTKTTNYTFVKLHLHIEAIFVVYDDTSNNRIATVKLIIPAGDKQNRIEYAVSITGNKLQLKEHFMSQLGELRFGEIEYSEPEDNNLKFSKTLLETKLNEASFDMKNVSNLLEARTKISIMWAFYRYNNGSLPIWSKEEEILRGHFESEELNTIYPRFFKIDIPPFNLNTPQTNTVDKYELNGMWKLRTHTDRILNLSLYQRDDLILEMDIPLKGRVWHKIKKKVIFQIHGYIHVKCVLKYDSKKALTIKSNRTNLRISNFYLMNDNKFGEKQLSQIYESVVTLGASYQEFNNDITTLLSSIVLKQYNAGISEHYVKLFDMKIPDVKSPLPQHLICSFKTNEGPEATLTNLSLPSGQIDKVQFKLNSVKLTYKIGPSNGIIIGYKDLLYSVLNTQNFFKISSIDTSGTCTQTPFPKAGAPNLLHTVDNSNLVVHRKLLSNVVIHYYTPLLVKALESYLEGMLND